MARQHICQLIVNVYSGYWEELVSFTRSLFNSAFKTNPYLERAIMTGITRVSKESLFSDLNNLKVVTTTSEEYATSFGFTERETFEALEECGLGEEKENVKRWYDGFVFGSHGDIYNPWSILNFLNEKKYGAYWANTSSNSLAGKRIREGSGRLKVSFERLLQGEVLRKALLIGDKKAMNVYMNRMALSVFSCFDTGRRPSGQEPERFCHGFTLGLMVELQTEYVITSNRESGFGRYDVVLEPRRPAEKDAIILEFKVHDPEDEQTLEDTVQAALAQIEEKKYADALRERGIPKERIRSYGFAFEGKKVLVG